MVSGIPAADWRCPNFSVADYLSISPNFALPPIAFLYTVVGIS
jgi:hypothetical protein